MSYKIPKSPTFHIRWARKCSRNKIMKRRPKILYIKYLRSLIQGRREIDVESNIVLVQRGWMKFASEVFCDKNIPHKLKVNFTEWWLVNFVVWGSVDHSKTLVFKKSKLGKWGCCGSGIVVDKIREVTLR